jgi:hypothetical protein
VYSIIIIELWEGKLVTEENDDWRLRVGDKLLNVLEEMQSSKWLLPS